MAYLIVTIDTEEDNWGEYTRASYSVDNIGRVERLQRVFDRWSVRPTYLITHPVAANSQSASTLARLQRRGVCEIGTHLHPWNTPPAVETRTPENSFLSNLPPELQYQKLRALHDVISNTFDRAPTSYRSGRWGFNADVARALIRLGYAVDTSVYPLWDWSGAGGPDFREYGPEPFVYTVSDSEGGGGTTLLEIPATIDFLQAWRRLAGGVYWAIRRSLPVPDKIVAGLGRLRLLNHVCLSPELALASQMIGLADAMLTRGATVLNMFFHSPSLLPGCSPFVRTEAEAEAFIERVDAFLAFAHGRGLAPATFGELTPTDVGARVARSLTPVETRHQSGA